MCIEVLDFGEPFDFYFSHLCFYFCSGQSADAIVSDGNLKESKKGLFGRSAEFLKVIVF